jgi:hypothetical protein
MVMEQYLNLIKNDEQKVEKRIFPRFPFSYLTYKMSDSANSMVFEVINISDTGMQLCLKSGGHNQTPGSEVKGALHWKNAELKTSAKIEWVKGSKMGLSFLACKEFKQKVAHFLSLERVATCMQNIIDTGLELELPTNLKCWVRSDGPCEIFVWSHSHGELSRFELILFNHFIEWQDGRGIQTGRVLQKRDLDTPLCSEDEFMVSLDNSFDPEKIERAKELISNLTDRHISESIRAFVERKLRLA